MLQRLWATIKVSTLLGVAAFVTGVALSLLGSVSYVDALEYFHWVDGGAVPAPQPGQYYVVGDDGTVQEPLCALRGEDFPFLEHQEHGVRLVNLLGNAVPGALQLVGLIVPAVSITGTGAGIVPSLELSSLHRQYMPLSLLLAQTRTVLAERDMAAIAKGATGDQIARAERLERCAEAIVSSLGAGLLVCQLSTVVRQGPSGVVLGVDFPTECLVRQGDDGPSTFPGPGSASFWARARRTLGLIEAIPLASDDAGGAAVASRS